MRYGVFYRSLSGWKIVCNTESLTRAFITGSQSTNFQESEVVVIDRLDGRKIIKRFNFETGFKIMTWCNKANIYYRTAKKYEDLVSIWKMVIPVLIQDEIQYYFQFGEKFGLSDELWFITKVFKGEKLIAKTRRKIVLRKESPMNWNRFGF